MDTKACNQFQYGLKLVAVDGEGKVNETVEVLINGNACRVKVKELEGDPVNAVNGVVSTPKEKSKQSILPLTSSDKRDSVQAPILPEKDDALEFVPTNDMVKCGVKAKTVGGQSGRKLNGVEGAVFEAKKHVQLYEVDSQREFNSNSS